MASNQPPAIMTSSAFRYAVLVVLSVVIIMGASMYYRTHAYRRHHPHIQIVVREAGLAAPSVAAHDWGPKPKLFDVYLGAAREKPESEWDEIRPISVTPDAVDSSGASSLARICLMIQMPLSRPLKAREALPDDEARLPHLEIGQSDVNVLLKDVKSLRSSSDEKG
ncbi:Polyketide beta-ketoacyl-synthase [Mycena sanguinolenta]|uniref:Polyketide beta-ketoacyl-synthase n=1 Tax=Mycena sanguinolenta TaxID=230812 RepID=A0A8H6ZGW1_9AGAR|nr:Polyketide beta-ketoacyl-synthase [Mycena sanguinolenta]